MDIKSCELCGRLFHSYGSDICPECSKQIEKDLSEIQNYLSRGGKRTSAADIAEQTNVPEKTVLYLIKDGRLSKREVLTGDVQKCAMCGRRITSGRLCPDCLKKWNDQVAALGLSTKPEQEERDPNRQKGKSRMHVGRGE